MDRIAICEMVDPGSNPGTSTSVQFNGRTFVSEAKDPGSNPGTDLTYVIVI